MCLAQGPQHSDAGEARTLGLKSSTLPLSHCAPCVMTEFVMTEFVQNCLCAEGSGWWVRKATRLLFIYPIVYLWIFPSGLIQ